MKKNDIKRILKDEYDFIYPDWWECQWRRIACGHNECPLCGRIMKQYFKHKFKGEAPDNIGSLLQDAEDSFEEAFQLINESAHKEGIDLYNLNDNIEMPPDPEGFSEYKKPHDWILKMHKFAKENCDMWAYSEAGQDLMWYANLIPAKAYRNLCNKWHLKKGHFDDNIDYYYTKYVLENCIQIVKESFETVISMHLPQKNEFICLYNQFLEFENEILSI